jgi:hypothetical protein
VVPDESTYGCSDSRTYAGDPSRSGSLNVITTVLELPTSAVTLESSLFAAPRHVRVSASAAEGWPSG